MSYAHRRYLLMTLDPTHIGAGGYRIGRVDNSIVREPGSNLPKIPGTSLSGAIRSYAAYRYGKIRCAGQGQPNAEQNKEGHCGKDGCPICYTFGFTKGEGDDVRSYSGTVNIYDAHIVLFPVSSMIGPLWISTKHRLEEFKFKVTGAEQTVPENAQLCALTLDHKKQPINLGWLMLDTEETMAEVKPPHGSGWEGKDEWKSIKSRIAIVPESLFSQLVNSGLEVRTSVSIDPATGAAESGALFTYEAIPRATFLAFDLVQDDYRVGAKPWSDVNPVVRAATRKEESEGSKKKVIWTDNDPTGNPIYPDSTNATQPEIKDGKPRGWTQPHHVVHSGLEWSSALGIGGMSTRGFGRIGLVGNGWPVPPNAEVQHA